MKEGRKEGKEDGATLNYELQAASVRTHRARVGRVWGVSGEREDGKRGRNSPVLEQKRNIEITMFVCLFLCIQGLGQGKQKVYRNKESYDGNSVKH